MPFALLAAVIGSLAIHAVALFGTDYELFGEVAVSPPLQAELRMPEPPPAKSPAPVAAPRPTKLAKSAKLAKSTKRASDSPPVPVFSPPDQAPEIAAESGAAGESVENADFAASTAEILPSASPKPAREAVLAGAGYLRFAVFKAPRGLEIGRAEHRWTFPGDGSYRLTSVIETSGLIALFKPLQQQHESVGHLGPGGLQPDTFRTWKNGQATRENADFDWSTAEVRLMRDDSRRSIAPGTQDILSLNYQLAYLPAPEEGSTLGVVTGRKYERYALDALGEAVIETPAGTFRTLHLRAVGETVTEIWIALDHQRLPVKIRFTDKKGDSYEQIVTELGVGKD